MRQEPCNTVSTALWLLSIHIFLISHSFIIENLHFLEQKFYTAVGDFEFRTQEYLPVCTTKFNRFTLP